MKVSHALAIGAVQIIQALAVASLNATPDPTSLDISRLADDTLPPHTHQTLLPAVHWDWPTNDLRNLDPTDYVNLHYTEDGTSQWDVEHAFASMGTTLRHKTVVLEHSAFVRDITCQGDSLSVLFSSLKALKYASRAWKTDGELVFVTNHLGCGSSKEERMFWLVDNLIADRAHKTVYAHIEREIKPHDTLGEVQMVWGVHKPKEEMRKRAVLRRRQAEGTPVYGGAPTTTAPAKTTTAAAGLTTTRPAATTTRPATTTTAPGPTTSEVCGPAPGKMIDGFPAADCGSPTFDDDIDAALGYIGFEREEDWAADIKDFSPEIDFDADELDYGVGNMRKRTLHKRIVGTWLAGAVGKVASRGLQLLNKPKDLLVDKIRQIPVVGKLVQGLTVYNPKISGSQKINLGPNEDSNTTFGKGALIYTKASAPGDKLQYTGSLYCVDCGIRGEVELVGRAQFDVLKLAVTELRATVTADLRAGLHLVLSATGSYTDSSTKQLVRQPIPKLGVAVKGVFAVGCIIGVDAKTDIEVRASGEAIAGVAMLLPNFKAEVNILGDGPGQKVTGYEPKFIRQLSVNGGMSANAKLSLPVSFNVGVDIPLLKATSNQGKYTISLIEAPGIQGDFAYVGGTDSSNPTNSTCYNGVDFGITLTNDISVNIFNKYTYPIQNYKNQIVKQCFGKKQTPVHDPREGTTTQRTTNSRRRQIHGRQTDETTNGEVIDAEPGDTIIVAPPGTIVIVEDDTPEAEADFSDTPGSAEGSDIVDASEDSSAIFEELQTAAMSEALSAENVQGFTFTAIKSVNNDFVLVPDEDGNVYAGAYDAEDDAATYSYFGALQGVAAIDNQGRILHYYPEEMKAFSVSRIRLSDEQKLATGSDLIALRLVDAGEGPAVLVAVNTMVEQQAFVLVMCNLPDKKATQLFLVNGPEGLDALVKNDDLTYTLTGAQVESCGTVQLVYAS